MSSFYLIFRPTYMANGYTYRHLYCQGYMTKLNQTLIIITKKIASEIRGYFLSTQTKTAAINDSNSCQAKIGLNIHFLPPSVRLLIDLRGNLNSQLGNHPGLGSNNSFKGIARYQFLDKAVAADGFSTSLVAQ